MIKTVVFAKAVPNKSDIHCIRFSHFVTRLSNLFRISNLDIRICLNRIFRSGTKYT
jgi:hypothetical protein